MLNRGSRLVPSSSVREMSCTPSRQRPRLRRSADMRRRKDSSERRLFRRPSRAKREPPAPGRNGERDFHGEKRSNETHASTTDPDARLARKSNGQAAKLCYAGHVVMKSRHGLVVGEGLACPASRSAVPVASVVRWNAGRNQPNPPDCRAMSGRKSGKPQVSTRISEAC